MKAQINRCDGSSRVGYSVVLVVIIIIVLVGWCSPEIGNYGQQDLSGPQPVFVKTVLLEESCILSFAYCLWLLQHCNSRVEWL